MSTPRRRSRGARLEVERREIPGHRLRSAGLLQRATWSESTVRTAAWVGLCDSMPRTALTSLHARIEGVGPHALDDAMLMQVWGPRFSVYVVAEHDVAVFTLGRLTTDRRAPARVQDLAKRSIARFGGEASVPVDEAGRALGAYHNAVRDASPTGILRLRWDGARRPTMRVVAAPGHGAARCPPRTRMPIRPCPRTDHTGRLRGAWSGVKPRQAAATSDDWAAS